MADYSWLDDKSKIKKLEGGLDDGSYSGVINEITIDTTKNGHDRTSLFVELRDGRRIRIAYLTGMIGGAKAFAEAFPFLKSADAKDGFNVLAGLKIDFNAKLTSDGKWTRYTVTKVYRKRDAGYDDDTPPAQSGGDDELDDIPF